MKHKDYKELERLIGGIRPWTLGVGATVDSAKFFSSCPLDGSGGLRGREESIRVVNYDPLMDHVMDANRHTLLHMAARRQRLRLLLA